MSKSNQKAENTTETHDSIDIYEDMFEKQVHDYIEKHKEEKFGKDHQTPKELNVFKIALELENRYNYIIKKAEERKDEAIKQIEKYNGELKRMILSEQRNNIEREMIALKNDIEESLEDHKKKEREMEDKIRKVYEENKQKILQEILDELGFNF